MFCAMIVFNVLKKEKFVFWYKLIANHNLLSSTLYKVIVNDSTRNNTTYSWLSNVKSIFDECKGIGENND